jgi:hypothetical protein
MNSGGAKYNAIDLTPRDQQTSPPLTAAETVRGSAQGEPIMLGQCLFAERRISTPFSSIMFFRYALLASIFANTPNPAWHTGWLGY